MQALSSVLPPPPPLGRPQAVEHIRRKGKHCRVMVAPMIPAAAERAASSEGDEEGGTVSFFAKCLGGWGGIRIPVESLLCI